MKTKKITVLMCGRGPIQEGVLDAFSATLRQAGVPFELDLFCAEGLSDKALLDHVKGLSLSEVDLVLAVGMGAARVVSKQFSQREESVPPVLFAGVHKAFAQHANRTVSFMTGVAVSTVANQTLFNLLFKLYPNVRSVVLPYCKEAQGGQITECLQALGEHAAQQYVRAIPVEMSQEAAAVTLEGYIATADAVVIPVAGATAHESELCEELCKKYGKVLVGDGITSGQACGVTVLGLDTSAMGTRLAEFTHQLLVEGAAVADLPVHQMDIKREIFVNTERLAQAGIFVPDDVLRSLGSLMGAPVQFVKDKGGYLHHHYKRSKLFVR